MFERLLGRARETDGAIAANQFRAMLNEYRAGRITAMQVARQFDLVGDPDLSLVLKRIDELSDDRRSDFSETVWSVMVLAEAGILYERRRDLANRLRDFV